MTSSSLMRSGALLGAATALGISSVTAQDQTATQPKSDTPPTPASFAPVAEDIMPAVVNITIQRGASNAGGPMAGLPEDHPLREFFERFGEGRGGMPGQGQGGQPPRQMQGAGSGFIIDEAGYIVTNNHVVQKAEQVEVSLSDGRSFEAEVAGTDPRTDVALLKIDAEGDLPEVDWGASSDIKVGDWALAIGNPFGLGGSVTAGIVSARGRDIDAGPYSRFIQTDTAINRGSSGGPLFNAAGNVVGVNTAILSPSGGNVGVGFALPSRVAQPIIAELKSEGEVVRGWLGVRVQPVTPEIATGLDIDEPRGALVAKAVDGSPAAEAGLKEGDVIVGFGDRTVEDAGQLAWYASQGDPGDKVELSIWRDGEKITQEVTLGELTQQSERASQTAPEQDDMSATARALGMQVAEATDQIRQRLDIPQQVEGVVVTKVARGGPAAQQGLRPGHVITQFGRQTVSTPDELNERVNAAIEDGRNGVVMLVQAGDSAQFVSVPLATPQAG